MGNQKEVSGGSPHFKKVDSIDKVLSILHTSKKKKTPPVPHADGAGQDSPLMLERSYSTYTIISETLAKTAGHFDLICSPRSPSEKSKVT